MMNISLEESTPTVRTGVVTDADDGHDVDLLEQFYLTLRVMSLAAPRVESSAIHDRLDRLFRDVHSWRNAYEIEQLLCFVMTDQQLETELERRLAEAKALKIEHVDVIDQELHASTVAPAAKRIVLHRLLNDLQWFYTKRIQYRAASKLLMLRVSSLFMVALVVLFLVLFIQFFAQGRPAVPSSAQSPLTDQGAATPGVGSHVNPLTVSHTSSRGAGPRFSDCSMRGEEARVGIVGVGA